MVFNPSYNQDWSRITKGIHPPSNWSNGTDDAGDDIMATSSSGPTVSTTDTIILWVLFIIFLILLYISEIYRKHKRGLAELSVEDQKRKKLTDLFEKSGCQLIVDEQKHIVPPNDESKEQEVVGDEEAPEGLVLVPTEATEYGVVPKVGSSCIICLEPYQDGDAIVWSQDKECRHAFHRECFIDYLVAHKGGDSPCPACRRDFVAVV